MPTAVGGISELLSALFKPSDSKIVLKLFPNNVFFLIDKSCDKNQRQRYLDAR